jgi:hypothetical protein
MGEVHIYKADGVWREDPPESVVIRIENEAPQLDHGLPSGEYARIAGERFAAEGEALAEAIWSACPGGTVDALLAALLTRKSSLLRVTHSQEKKP